MFFFCFVLFDFVVNVLIFLVYVYIVVFEGKKFFVVFVVVFLFFYYCEQ